MPTSITFFSDYLCLGICTMVVFRLKLIFFIILSLQLSVISSQENKNEMNGVSMTLHTKTKMRLKSEPTKKITVEEPLYYPSNYYEYHIKLSVGTPPQDALLVMDTGSDVVWVACTANYTCNNCNGYTTVFLPRKSSSHVAVRCADPKCKDLCKNRSCVESFQKCSRICPHFRLTYGTGNATGRLLTETLTLPLEDGGRREIKHFAIGCSGVSNEIAGIAGLGRGGLSMPSQLAPLFGDRFAYCLDHVNNSSKIVFGGKAVRRDIPLTYTPLLNNSVNPSHYYLGLEAVSIGGKRLTLPSNLSTFDNKGNGGTIIDSGASFSLFPDAMYSQIAGEFASHIGYKRALGVETTTGFGLCYNVSGVENIQWPIFAFHFKDGSDMILPDDNSFERYSSDTYCLAMVNTSFLEVAVAPAVLIGNFQQQNLYILYDKKKNRLGFTQKSCTALG